ncbi:MAG: PEGA domain-containing protein, partial [Rhodothermaceae bacterium]
MKINVLFLIFALILVSCEKEVSVTVPQPKQPQGTIIVNSVPEGATILLDGKNLGKVTP